MKRFVVVSILTAALSGCPDIRNLCESECGPAARCDPESRSCVGIPVDDGTCSATGCPDWQFCSEMVCRERYTGVMLVTPQEGALVSGTFSITARIDTIAPNVPRKDPGQIQFTVRPAAGGSDVSGVLAKTTEGAYAGQVTGIPNGMHDVIVSFDGTNGSDSARVTVDTMPPTLTIDMISVTPPSRPSPDWNDPQLPSGAWKRDETTTLFVSSTEPIVNPAFTLRGANDGGTVDGGLTSVDAGCGTATFCGRATLDFAAPAMNAFRGNFRLTVTGGDVAGNAGSAAMDLPVTRYKWMKALGVGGAVRSPAIGSTGTVYSASGNTLYATKPDGNLKWAPLLLGSMTASPAVGKADGGLETIYIAASPVNAPQLIAVVDGGIIPGAACPSTTTGGSIRATPMVTTLGGVEGAVSFINNRPDIALVSLRPFDTTPCGGFASTTLGNALFPTNVIGQDNKAFVATDNRGLHAFTYPAPGVFWTHDSSVPDAGSTSGTSLAADTNRIVLGAGPGLTGTPVPSGTVWASFATGNIRYAVFSTSDDIILVDEGSPSFLRLVSYGDDTAMQSRSMTEPTTSPIVGRDGLIYVVGVASGQVRAYTPDLIPLWSEDGAPPSNSNSSPTIDCARDSNGTKLAGRPGTLYFGTDTGELRAVIVDSRGINITGTPWPKYQRDPRNTGSLSTDMTEFACP